jgi:hypothetical protein
VSPQDALVFVQSHGIVLESARGPLPSLAEVIAGGPIRGSWWSAPKAREIFRASRALRDSPDILVCTLVEGKVTFVHRRLWPALVKLASRFRRPRLARIREEHTASGAHQTRRTPFPEWVPSEVLSEARQLSHTDAERMLWSLLPLARRKVGRRHG